MSFYIPLPKYGTFEAWREAARLAISHRISPDELDWNGQQSLFEGIPLPQRLGDHVVRVSPDFLRLAKTIIWHSSDERFYLLYQALWRLDRRDGAPLSQAEPLGRRLGLMAKSVGRDIHKMHAFVRFREIPTENERRSFGAWFEPEHYILEPASSFFRKRFADMDWVIATPHLTGRYQAGKLSFEEGGEKPDLTEDASQALWGTYFANIFNPARVKLNAMRSEMPKKYWKNLPETRLIPSMLADAEARVKRMHEAGSSQPRRGSAVVSTRYRATMPMVADMPENLDEARQTAMQCRRCNLCEAATQTVWGEGNPNAKIMIVGEQAGDHEDLTGRPFVGPAGQLLRKVMDEASLKPESVWLTNAVKHFKFASRGSSRLHKNPNQSEIELCRWWLGLELAFIVPSLTLALGASAAFALTGNHEPILQRRGKIETGLHGGRVLISWHPSYILRSRDPMLQKQFMQEFEADIATAAAFEA